MSNKEVLQEGILDWIKRNREGYKKAVEDPGKAGGIAGAVGTGLGTLTRFARDKAVPAVGRGLQKVGGAIAGQTETKKPVVKSPTEPVSPVRNPNALATVAAGIAAKKRAGETSAKVAAYNKSKSESGGSTLTTQKPPTNKLAAVKRMDTKWQTMKNATSPLTKPNIRLVSQTPKKVQ
jgi:hypothetical protein